MNSLISKTVAVCVLLFRDIAYIKTSSRKCLELDIWVNLKNYQCVHLTLVHVEKCILDLCYCDSQRRIQTAQIHQITDLGRIKKLVYLF